MTNIFLVFEIGCSFVGTQNDFFYLILSGNIHRLANILDYCVLSDTYEFIRCVAREYNQKYESVCQTQQVDGN